jgi:hypothetical protein
VRDLYEGLGVDPEFSPPSLERRVNASGTSQDALDESLVQRLRDFFKESDDRLRDELGREVPWDLSRT